eukprot:gene8520-9436_t
MALDNGSVVGTLFIEFEKPFDIIEHQILGMKLQAVGIFGNFILSSRFIWPTDNNTLIMKGQSQIFIALNMAFHKGPYWDHGCYPFSLLTCPRHQRLGKFIYMRRYDHFCDI